MTEIHFSFKMIALMLPLLFKLVNGHLEPIFQAIVDESPTNQFCFTAVSTVDLKLDSPVPIIWHDSLDTNHELKLSLKACPHYFAGYA